LKTLINPIEKTITLPDGSEKIFILSKFDAIPGREIVSQYPVTGMPKLGDYAVNEQIMLKLMSFVAVQNGDTKLSLTSKDLVNNHVESWETLARLELAMMEYNCSFFGNGKASTFFEQLAAKIPGLISSMLTDLSGQLSQQTKLNSGNSEPSTH